MSSRILTCYRVFISTYLSVPLVLFNFIPGVPAARHRSAYYAALKRFLKEAFKCFLRAMERTESLETQNGAFEVGCYGRGEKVMIPSSHLPYPLSTSPFLSDVETCQTLFLLFSKVAKHYYTCYAKCFLEHKTRMFYLILALTKINVRSFTTFAKN